MLTERDKKHIWHPLTQHKTHPGSIAIKRAEGALLFDENDKPYIDGISSWYTAMYGHCNPYITSRVSEQMQHLDQVVFSGFTHEPAVKLSEELIELLPENQNRLFFSDNGSTAVEVGIKMALQYHFNRGEKRNRLIAFENGFHGDTFGAMSVSGLSVYNGPFNELAIEVLRIPVPDGNNNREVLDLLKQHAADNRVAAFVFEPLVQGAAAMKMHDVAGLDSLVGWCKEHNIITVADEVMTGFGKTGRNFASEYLYHMPDIICMSKALTAGLLPMAVTSTTEEVFNAFYSEDMSKGFFHGHTYTANPLACRAALAGIELLKSDSIQQNIQRIIRSHQQWNDRIKDHPKVSATRQLGVIFALDLNIAMSRYGRLRDQLFQFFMENGVFLRPLGNTIYILAPYITTASQMEEIYKVIERALDSLE